MHDLHLERPTPGRCFAVTGAERSLSLLVEWGADHDTATTVAAAVSGHANPGADRDLSDPAGFVLAGSLADIIGRRLDETDASWLRDLIERYPRPWAQEPLGRSTARRGECCAARTHVPRRPLGWAFHVNPRSSLPRVRPLHDARGLSGS
jgi:hypothetical protein